MVRVLATGTFDILHPGHLVYLEEAKKLGDELVVIVARDINVKHKPKPVLPEEQRLRMVSSLSMVDKAMLGSEKDIFEFLYSLKPDIIAIGYDQHFKAESLKKDLESRGLKGNVVRIKTSDSCKFCSSRAIIKHILEKESTQ